LIVAFLGLFVAVGTGIGYFLSFRPIYRAYQARSWTAADCEVISSRVVSSDDTSRPDIRYRYYVNDRPYVSDRYNFIPGSTSDSTVPDTVERYPAGRRFQCFVDPADPTEAVINREVTGWYYFGLAFFGGFAGIPLLIGAVVIRGRSARRAADAAPITRAPDAAPVTRAFDGAAMDAASGTGPLVLQPTASPLGKLIAITLICLFWNGIVGLFTFFEIREFTAGTGNWFLAIFLLLFQIIGVALLLAVPYQLLALANPRPAITLSRATVPLGSATPFEWKLTGTASRVTRLTITLKGQEQARYRRGTDTHTDTHTFHDEVLAEATDPMGIERGGGTIRVPADTMHSFNAFNNKIIWTLHVKGDINRWPDVDDSFEIKVTPS
jgi:hypothetical protein